MEAASVSVGGAEALPRWMGLAKAGLKEAAVARVCGPAMVWDQIPVQVGTREDQLAETRLQDRCNRREGMPGEWYRGRE